VSASTGQASSSERKRGASRVAAPHFARTGESNPCW